MSGVAGVAGGAACALPASTASSSSSQVIGSARSMAHRRRARWGCQRGYGGGCSWRWSTSHCWIFLARHSLWAQVLRPQPSTFRGDPGVEPRVAGAPARRRGRARRNSTRLRRPPSLRRWAGARRRRRRGALAVHHRRSRLRRRRRAVGGGAAATSRPVHQGRPARRTPRRHWPQRHPAFRDASARSRRP